MQTPRLEEVRLTSFKSFTDQRLPLQALTLLIGRNGSGKSNALDALTVLSRLALGEPVRDALDGPRHGGEEPIRGGAEGCAPLGRDTFAIGCRVRVGEAVYDFDVEIEVRPAVRILRERLVAVEGALYGNRRLPSGRVLLATRPYRPHEDLFTLRYFNGRKELEEGGMLSRDRLACSLAPLLLPETRAGHLVREAARHVLAALKEVFLLDPVPHLMRRYVPERDTELRRSADNLSAVVAELRRHDPRAFGRLKKLISGMPEYPVVDVDTVVTSLGDVQLVLHESGFHGAVHEIPARLLSDGMLRFLAFGTAMLDVSEPSSATDLTWPERLLVIEEIENGLYPTQAARVLRLMREESRRGRIEVLFTTHSPALLNALTAEDHSGVLVCTRDPDSGESRLTRLTDLPGYVELLAAGDLGDAVTKGRLPDAVRPRDAEVTSVEDFLRSL
ncbi:ATP-binding protein [Streptomyces sp. MnatMP-M17]|uniref:AAA family ATPase n=1 Tax=unclassified Streptomyces TaxID=2593676 RepID=UPI00081DA894|nr:ATP-binding protein [Streptomyces sp. MnatMP-M17]MYZ37782.1 AAA family ATPase [Streptomyces sp. SID4917]SCF94072.1 Predicted ATPase [Streptomyces sp. MnatMP-M17]